MREFATLVGIGALIGLPLAYYGIHWYLTPFLERAPIGIWTMLAALLLAVIVAFLSTLRHTLTAMRLTPVSVLRD